MSHPSTTAVLIGAVIVPDAAANAQVPVAYYVATLSVLGTIFVVLKTWKWVRGEMKDVAKGENAALKAEIVRLNDKMDVMVDALKRFPCVRDPQTRTRAGDCPAVTPPFGLPVAHHEETGT